MANDVVVDDGFSISSSSSEQASNARTALFAQRLFQTVLPPSSDVHDSNVDDDVDVDDASSLLAIR